MHAGMGEERLLTTASVPCVCAAGQAKRDMLRHQ
jgi:hypothetical protein